MNRYLTIISICVLLAINATGCMMLGPDYRTPTAPLESEWLETGDPLLDTTAPVTPEWWQEAFNDAVLDQLVADALSQNLSLRSAGLRVLQARQQLMIAIGNQYPQQQQISGDGGKEGFLSSSANEFYDLGFNLTWEADVWGRFRRQIESASDALSQNLSLRSAGLRVLQARQQLWPGPICSSAPPSSGWRWRKRTSVSSRKACASPRPSSMPAKSAPSMWTRPRPCFTAPGPRWPPRN